MKEENKHCYNCLYYGPLYSKGYNQFDKSRWGTCKSSKVKEKGEICGDWRYNSDFNKRLRSKFEISASVKLIEDMQKNLTEISQILRETQDIEEV